MKRKGFTLVELLVVIAIIALLMGILMPALARVRSIAYRLVCGTNLSGIGKAMVLYANDYEEDYPVAGPRDVTWTDSDEITAWDGDDLLDAITDSEATVTSCFYLLVKWYDLPHKQFICKGDLGAKAFALNISGGETETSVIDFELEDAWDFGGKGTGQPGNYCSYSYHYPFPMSGKDSGYPISISSQPSAPLGADRNPWLDKNATNKSSTSHLRDPDIARAVWRSNKYMDPDNRENSAGHGFDGQNVLYNDIHVNFEKHPNVGIQLDNIWKRWPVSGTITDRIRQLNGIIPTAVGTGSATEGNQDQKDAYLINEVQTGWEAASD